MQFTTFLNGIIPTSIIPLLWRGKPQMARGKSEVKYTKIVYNGHQDLVWHQRQHLQPTRKQATTKREPETSGQRRYAQQTAEKTDEVPSIQVINILA